MRDYKYELKENLVELYDAAVWLNQITEEYEWWMVTWNVDRVEKLTKDINKLIEKINEML